MTLSITSVCPTCGRGSTDASLPPHGSPDDSSLDGLLCSVLVAQRLLSGDHEESVEGEDPDCEYVADLLGQALARFTGEG